MSHGPDCDYVDGELEEHNVGEKERSAVQAFFIKRLATHEELWKLEAYPEIRMRVSPTRMRVADIAILLLNAPFEGVLTRPPVSKGSHPRTAFSPHRAQNRRVMGTPRSCAISRG